MQQQQTKNVLTFSSHHFLLSWNKAMTVRNTARYNRHTCVEKLGRIQNPGLWPSLKHHILGRCYGNHCLVLWVHRLQKKKGEKFYGPKENVRCNKMFYKTKKMCHNHAKENKMLKRAEEQQVTFWSHTEVTQKSHGRQQNISLNKRKYVTFPVWHKLQHNASCNLLGKGSQFIIKQMATKYFRLLLKMATYSQFKQVATCIYISLENDVTLRIHTDTEMFHIIITLENAVICNALGLKHNPQHTLWKLYHIHNSHKYRNVLCHKKSETRMT